MKVLAAILLLNLVAIVSSAAKWTRLNHRPVCYGAKGNSFGVFHVEKQVKAYQVKLVRISGQLACVSAGFYSYFSCIVHRDQFEVHVTDSKNKIIVPPIPVRYKAGYGAWYYLNGHRYGANTVVISTGVHPYTFKRGKEYRVWNGEDLFNLTEYDNSGHICVNVYALQ
eukprot:gene19927-21879_t